MGEEEVAGGKSRRAFDLEGPEQVAKLLRVGAADVDDGGAQAGRGDGEGGGGERVEGRAVLPLAGAVVDALAMGLELVLERNVALRAVRMAEESRLVLLEFGHEGTLEGLCRFEFPLMDVLLDILEMALGIYPAGNSMGLSTGGKLLSFLSRSIWN